MSELQDTSLGQLLEFQRGFDLPKEQLVEGDYPVISSNGIFGYHNEYKVKAPGVTIGRSGTVGLPQFIEQDFFPHNTSLFVKDFKGNDERYIYYLLKNLKLNDKKTGTGVPTMNRNDLHPLEIKAYIDKPTQQKIAETLSILDKKIALNNRINTELENLAKTIYNYWFVQFDFPNAEGKPYKTSGGEMEWNEELKREIPKGWEVQKIGEYADVRKGDLITAKDANDGEIKVVAAGIDFSYTHTEFNRERNTITISGSGANAGFINFWREPIFASDCITVRGNTDTETLQLLYYLKFIQSHILQKATGSAQPHVYPDDIKNLYYAIPNYSTIEKFGVAIIPLNELIATCIKQNNELIKLRDFLLPLLMNGQVKIKSEAKEQLSMAAEPQVKYGK